MAEEDKKSGWNLYGYLLIGIALIAFLVIVYLIFIRGYTDLGDFFGNLFEFNLLNE